MDRVDLVLLIYLISVVTLSIFLYKLYKSLMIDFFQKKLSLILEEKTRELENEQLERIFAVASLVDIGKLTTGIVHNVRDVLSVINIVLSTAEKNNANLLYVDKAHFVINKLNDLMQTSTCRLSSKATSDYFSLNDEIKRIIYLFEYDGKLNEIKIIFQPNKEFEIIADRMKLERVLINLISNAIESYKEIKDKKQEKIIFIKLDKKPRNLFITIKDYGVGIPEDVMKNVFKPYFSTKEKEISLGIGLYICKEIMTKDFGSKIKVYSNPKKGTSFRIALRKKFVLNSKPLKNSQPI